MIDDGMRRLAFFPAGRFSFSSAARLDRVETILAGAGAASSGAPKLSTFSRAGNFGDISEKLLRKHTRGSGCGHILASANMAQAPAGSLRRWRASGQGSGDSGALVTSDLSPSGYNHSVYLTALKEGKKNLKKKNLLFPTTTLRNSIEI